MVGITDAVAVGRVCDGEEDTLALKFYLDGGESYLSLVNTVYFARQEAMG